MLNTDIFFSAVGAGVIWTNQFHLYFLWLYSIRMNCRQSFTNSLNKRGELFAKHVVYHSSCYCCIAIAFSQAVLLSSLLLYNQITWAIFYETVVVLLRMLSAVNLRTSHPYRTKLLFFYTYITISSNHLSIHIIQRLLGKAGMVLKQNIKTQDQHVQNCHYRIFCIQ